MRITSILVAVVIVLATAVTGLALGVEIGVGTEPSVSFAATWEFSPNFAMVASFGVAFGRGVQTGSSTVQTASYTVGVEARYNIRIAMSAVRPYLGLGAYVRMGSGDVPVLVSSSAGVQIRILPNVYLFGKGVALVPVLDVSGWYWRLELGAGFRLLF